MKLKASVAATCARAGIGKPLSDKEKRTLRALSEWILLGCPARVPVEEGTYAIDVADDEIGVWDDDLTLTGIEVAA